MFIQPKRNRTDYRGCGRMGHNTAKVQSGESCPLGQLNIRASVGVRYAYGFRKSRSKAARNSKE